MSVREVRDWRGFSLLVCNYVYGIGCGFKSNCDCICILMVWNKRDQLCLLFCVYMYNICESFDFSMLQAREAREISLAS